jgi:hypothetical protein
MFPFIVLGDWADHWNAMDEYHRSTLGIGSIMTGHGPVRAAGITEFCCDPMDSHACIESIPLALVRGQTVWDRPLILEHVCHGCVASARYPESIARSFYPGADLEQVCHWAHPGIDHIFVAKYPCGARIGNRILPVRQLFFQDQNAVGNPK